MLHSSLLETPQRLEPLGDELGLEQVRDYGKLVRLRAAAAALSPLLPSRGGVRVDDLVHECQRSILVEEANELENSNNKETSWKPN
jgi:hypothetical protein